MAGTCRSTLGFTRTDAERRDQSRSWARPDEAFFAAGACHILAWAAVERFDERFGAGRFGPVLLRPRFGAPGLHVFATDGERAFDFNGWSRQADLLAVTAADYGAAHPGWAHDLVPVGHLDIDGFCAAHGHRHPSDFAAVPWARAHRYLDRFPSDFSYRT